MRKKYYKAKILNRDVIKYIAMFLMLLNHIATIFMDSGHMAGQIVRELFLDLGYFTAPVMCYFLVEGFYYTRSQKKYAIRLLIFAVLSEFPYCLAFTQKGIIQFQGFNMLFTLFLCFEIVRAVEKISDKLSKIVVVTELVILSLMSDWALLAPVFTLLFLWSRNDKVKTRYAFLIGTLLFGLMNFLGGIGRFSLKINMIYTLGSMLGIGLAAVIISCFYNGKRMQKGKKFSKWFFYCFYPGHLLILGLIRILVFENLSYLGTNIVIG